MFTKLKIIIFFLIITANLYGSNKKFNSTITIKTDKQQYYIYEPIFLNYKVVNKDLIGPRIDPGFGLFPNFEVKDENGEYYSCDVNIDFIKDFEPLREKSIQHSIMLNYNYGKGFSIFLGSNYLPIGRYTIICVWREYGYDPLISNTIKIEIVDPPTKHKEEKELFEKAVNLGALRNNIDKQNEFFALMDELITKFPQGIYREYSLYMEITACLKYRKYLKGKITADMLFNDYPETRHIYIAIEAIAKYFIDNKNFKKGVEYLNTIIANTANEKIERACNLQIKELAKKEKKRRK